MVATALAAGLKPTRDLLPLVNSLKYEDLIAPFQKSPGWGLASLKTEKLAEQLGTVRRFEDCVLPLAVSVWDIAAFQQKVLKAGDLISAVRASCAVPFLFQAVNIDGRWYWDGGVGDLAGCAGVDKNARVLYHHCSVVPEGFAAVTKNYPRSVAVDLSNLPFPNPYRMEVGITALAATRAALWQLLDRPVVFRDGKGCLLQMSAPSMGVADARRKLDLAVPTLTSKL